MATFASKGVNLLIQLISLPLTINYLGYERFGLMATITTTLGVLTYADLGLGMGLQNKIPFLNVNNNHKEIKALISTTFWTLIAIGLIGAIVVAFSFSLIDWGAFFHVKDELSRQEAFSSVLLVVAILLLNLPFSVIQRVESALLRGYRNEFWLVASNILSLIALLVVTHFKLGVPFVILALQGVPALVLSVNFLTSFVRHHKDLAPSILDFDTLKILPLLQDGSIFLVLQIGALISNGSDTYLISKFIGNETVAKYTIAIRLAMLFAMPMQILTASLTNSYNDAFARFDYAWLQKTTTQFFKLTFSVSSVLALILLTTGNFVLYLWLKYAPMDINALVILAIFLFYSNFNSLISMIALSATYLRKLIILYPIAAILSLIVKVILLNYFRVSFTDILLANALLMSVFFLIPFVFIFIKSKLFHG